MKALISYPKRLAAWLWQGCHLFSGPIIAICVPLIAAWLWPNERGFRTVGFFLQVLGVWIVWIGIRGTREQFEVPGSWAQTKAWLGSFPRIRGRVINASMGAIELGAATAFGRGHVWHGPGEDATLEKRIDAIEKNLDNVRRDLSAFQTASDHRARAHAEEMKRERSEREAADNAIHEKIKETETGGLHLNAAGVWWLLSGTICSTFPGELADIVAWITA